MQSQSSTQPEAMKRRTIFSRLHGGCSDTLSHDDSQMFDSRIVHKNSDTGGMAATIKRDRDEESKEPSASVPSSSQAYKTYLEEMEFKIRYIKNDIEFKREQIRKRELKSSDSSTSSKKEDPLKQNSALPENKRRMVLYSRGTDKEVLGIIVKPRLSESSASTAPSQTLPHRILPSSASTAPSQTLPHRILPSSASTAHSQTLPHRILPSSASTAHSQTLTHKILPFKSNANLGSQSHVPPPGKVQILKKIPVGCDASKASKKPNSDSRVVHSLQLDSTASVPTHSRAVILPKSMQLGKSKSSSTPSSTIPVGDLSQNSRTVIRPATSIKDDQNHTGRVPTQAVSKGHIMKSDKSFAVVHTIPLLPVPSSSRISQSFNSVTSSRTAADKSPSKYKYIAPKLVENHSDANFSSISKRGPCPLPSITSALIEPTCITPSGRKSSAAKHVTSEAKSVKKFTPLTIKTAAKLVSKYKLKRLSPTTASKMAPLFHSTGTSTFTGAITAATSLLKERETSYDLASPRSRKANVFKIDKRKLKVNAISDTHYVSSTVPVPDKRLTPKYNTLRQYVVHDERKSHCRMNMKILSLPYPKAHRKQHAYGSVVGRMNRNQHHWSSSDRRTEDLKKSLAANRHASLARFRWKSSKLDASGVASPVDLARFRWSQSLVHKWTHQHKLRYVHQHRPYGGTSMSSFNVPYTSRMSQRSAKLVMIGGVVYKSSLRSLQRAMQDRRKHRTHLNQGPSVIRKHAVVSKELKHQNVKLICLRGVRYHLDARGKKLCRVHGSVTKKASSSILSGANGASLKSAKLALETLKDIQKKAAASRAVQRSLAYVVAKHRKDNRRLKKGKPRYCMFFCRFGKCHRGDACPYVHDQNKVVVCTRFLRGKCDLTNCRFSHDASVHKMPVCLYYLRGLCSRQDCMYLHVNVSLDAAPCKEFLQGYCTLGKLCKKLHSFLCPSFAVTGKCSTGEKCSLLHRHFKRSQNISHRNTSSFRFKSSPPVPDASADKPDNTCIGLADTSKLDNTHVANTSTPDSTHIAGTSTLDKDSTHVTNTSTPDSTRVAFTSTLDNTHVTNTSTLDSTHVTNTSSPDITRAANTSTPSSPQKTISPRSSSLAADDCDVVPLRGISSPLKSQPAFISLPSFGLSDILAKTVKKDINFLAAKERKTKIKPEFTLTDIGSPASKITRNVQGNVNVARPQEIFSHDNNETDILDPETSVKKRNSGFINLTSPANTDFITAEVASVNREEGSSQDSTLSSSTLQNAEESRDLGLENGVQSKAELSKASLLKGIIPDFLPLTGHGTNGPGSQ